MAEISVLDAALRERVGTGAARATRRGGRLPAVVYGGDGKEPLAISLDPRVIGTAYTKPGFFGQLFDITIDGAKHRSLCRDVQLDPVSDVPIHADFLRVTAATQINVEVPVHFINEETSPGLKRGGVLNVVRHTIEILSRADAIPSELIVDLAIADIGDSIHISQIDMPEGATPAIADRDFTIATIAAPSAMTEEEEEEAADEEAAAEAAEGAEAAEAEDKDKAEE